MSADDDELREALADAAAANPESSAIADSQLLSELEHRLFGRPRQAVRIDRYDLQELIGRGAFGLVYAAHDVELDRKVAVKLLHSRGEEASTDETLLSEAKSLARFAHPNVVAVFDVGRFRGATLGLPEDGVFVVMEHLAGPALDAWAKGRRWQEVVRTACDAGAGLAAAHGAGLVHRDFKPANVLLGGDDRPRILDFGLASLLDGPSSPAAVGSPAYMAPEQHLGAPPTPAVDQFSFCVTLYELLYGCRPFRGDTLEEMASAKLGGDYTRATNFRHVPARVGKLIDKGLCASATQRHKSMQDLLRALRRAVGARRRRVTMVLAAAGSLTFAGSMVLWQGAHGAATCEAEVSALHDVWDPSMRVRVRDRFRSQAGGTGEQSFSRVNRALDDYTTRWLDLRREACERSVVRREEPSSLMARRYLCLDRRLEHVAGITHMWASADAHAVRRAMDGIIALPELEPCLDTNGALGGDGHTDGVDPEVELDVETRLAQAQARIAAGRFSDAAAEAARAQALADERGASPAAKIRAGIIAGTAHRLAGDLDLAQAAIDDALALAELEGDDLLTAEASTTSIRILDSRGRHEEAARAAARTRGLVARVAPQTRLEGLLDYNEGVLRLHQGELARGEEVLRNGLELRTRLLGERHPLVAAMHNTLGNVLERRGETKAAIEHMERALDIWTEALGQEHPDVARVLNNLGNATKDQGDYRRALELYQRSLAAYELAFDADHPSLGIIHHNLGIMLDLMGERERSVEHFHRALEIRTARLPAPHPLTTSTLSALGATLLELGRLDEAEIHIGRALAAPVDDPHRFRALREHARLLALRGRGEQAMQALAEADAVSSVSLHDRADVLRILGRHEQATQAQLGALAVAERQTPTGHPDLAWQHLWLAECEWHTGDRTKAVQSARAALAELERAGLGAHPDLLDIAVVGELGLR